jgi:hypothetical protein
MRDYARRSASVPSGAPIEGFVPQEGVGLVDDIDHQELHFLVRDPTQPRPGNLAVRRDYFHVAVISTL